ncbi:hypothetical protein ACDQ55_08010 [Chitinophaga sp. 30R24]|uniref:hypothetical protein n=1 Tax=Chitinophaga sp. 30R24 TaxID=3248838 RepID=UPI003B8F7CBC
MNFQKSVVVPVMLFCLLSVQVQAQTLKNFLDNKDSSFTWLGVDFTQARLIGDAAANVSDIVARQFTGINQLVVKAPKKYDISGAWRRDKFTTDLSLVNKRNETVNKDLLKSDNIADYQRLKPEDITNLVKSYDFGGRRGIGFLIVMEGMNKSDKRASMYVTLVDMGKKHVLLTERYTGKAQGFSWRNYWAFTVSKVLDNVNDDFKKLKDKYADAKDPVEEKPATPPAPAAKKDSKTGMALKETKKIKKKG